MEIFVLSYVNVLCIYPRLCLQVGSTYKAQNRLDKPVCYTHMLFYVIETIYLYGNLSFFRIHVNRFMARDDSPGAKKISKCIL